MTFTLSPPVRYAALLGLIVALLVGGGMTVLAHRQSSVATPPVIKHHPFGAGVKKHANTTKPKKHSTTATKQKVKPKVTPTVPAAPKAAEIHSAVIAAIAAGLPNVIATALGRNQTVVVALYNPYSEVDGIAFAEARAGAKMAGVGFGLLPDPGMLIYIRPGTLVARISGFADKETVAQAAQNAARGT